MRQAIVIALSVGGRGNKVYESGDTVNENNFPPGNFDRLIKDGFIKEKIEETKTEPVDPDKDKGGQKNQSDPPADPDADKGKGETKTDEKSGKKK